MTPAISPPAIGTIVMMLNKNTKAMVRSPDGDINFDFVAGILY